MKNENLCAKAWSELKRYIIAEKPALIFKFPKADASKAFKLWKQYLENEYDCNSDFNEENFLNSEGENIYIVLRTDYFDTESVTYIDTIYNLIDYHKKQIENHKKQCDDLTAILSA